MSDRVHPLSNVHFFLFWVTGVCWSSFLVKNRGASQGLFRLTPVDHLELHACFRTVGGGESMPTPHREAPVDTGTFRLRCSNAHHLATALARSSFSCFLFIIHSYDHEIPTKKSSTWPQNRTAISKTIVSQGKKWDLS